MIARNYDSLPCLPVTWQARYHRHSLPCHPSQTSAVQSNLEIHSETRRPRNPDKEICKKLMFIIREVTSDRLPLSGVEWKKHSGGMVWKQYSVGWTGESSQGGEVKRAIRDCSCNFIKYCPGGTQGQEVNERQEKRAQEAGFPRWWKLVKIGSHFVTFCNRKNTKRREPQWKGQ